MTKKRKAAKRIFEDEVTVLVINGKKKNFGETKRSEGTGNCGCSNTRSGVA